MSNRDTPYYFYTVRNLIAVCTLFALGGCQEPTPHRLDGEPSHLENQADSTELTYFRTHVYPQVELHCATCHDYGSLNFTGNSNFDYASIRSFIDTQDPEASSLLLMATDTRQMHPGGRIISPDSEIYTAIVHWIELEALKD